MTPKEYRTLRDLFAAYEAARGDLSSARELFDPPRSRLSRLDFPAEYITQQLDAKRASYTAARSAMLAFIEAAKPVAKPKRAAAEAAAKDAKGRDLGDWMAGRISDLEAEAAKGDQLAARRKR